MALLLLPKAFLGQFGPGVVGWSGLSQDGCCPAAAAGGEVSRKRFTRLPSIVFSADPIDERFDLKYWAIVDKTSAPIGCNCMKTYTGFETSWVACSTVCPILVEIRQNWQYTCDLYYMVEHAKAVLCHPTYIHSEFEGFTHLFSEDCCSCCALRGAGRASRHF